MRMVQQDQAILEISLLRRLDRLLIDRIFLIFADPLVEHRLMDPTKSPDPESDSEIFHQLQPLEFVRISCFVFAVFLLSRLASFLTHHNFCQPRRFLPAKNEIEEEFFVPLDQMIHLILLVFLDSLCTPIKKTALAVCENNSLSTPVLSSLQVLF